MSGRFGLSKIRGLTNVAVVTKATPVDPSGQYRNLVGIEKFDKTFSLAGGMNMPKIISCHGSDGRAYKQVGVVCRVTLWYLDGGGVMADLCSCMQHEHTAKRRVHWVCVCIKCTPSYPCLLFRFCV